MLGQIFSLWLSCISLLPPLDAPPGNSDRGSNESLPGKVSNPPCQPLQFGGSALQTSAVAISADGMFIACGGSDHLLRIFDATGRQLLVAKGHEAPIRAVAFNPNGSHVASAGADHLLHPTGFVPRFLYRVDGSQAVPGLGEVLLPNSDRPEKQGNLPSGPIMMSGRPAMKGGVVRIWEVNTGRLIRTINEFDHPLDTISYASNGRFICTMDKYFTFSIRKSDSGEGWLTLTRDGMQRQYGEGPSTVTSIGQSSLRLVTTASQANVHKSTIKLWKAEGSKLEIIDAEGPYLASWAVAMRPDGKRFITAGKNGSLYEWDCDKCLMIREFLGRPTGIQTIEFMLYSPDGDRVIAGDRDGVAHLWDAVSGRFLKKSNGPGRPIRAAAFLVDGLRVVSGGYHTLDPKTATLETRGHADPVFVWEMKYK